VVIVMYQYIGLCICLQNVSERDGHCDEKPGTILEKDKYFVVTQHLCWSSALSYCQHHHAGLVKDITSQKVSFALAKSKTGLYRRRLVVL